MIKYLIVDDEPVAHDIIQDYSQLLPNMRLVGNCYDALQAIEILQKQKVDLMFLDLNMPKLKGFDFLRSLSHAPKVIVTSAYQEYAIEGFELDVIDYLLKPFDFSRFLKAVNKATSQPALPHSPTTEEEQSIFLKSDKKYIQIRTAEIAILEAAGNYTKILSGGSLIMVREKISDLLLTFNSDNLIQVHKSFVVSKKDIQSIEGNRIWIKDQTVPIGKTYRSQLTGLLGLK
ncbi:LytR/AlgR family response regulator transcription factor [Reichenbachiella ulvae]|uniref:Response regulator transcription factor n=1 Tax=Reichenbachiella ulvae TaxID=2980104 RepID=A0ABT3CT64_9BACT|nr:response regulator transcription factor [Reichenbachiella ulvae]MCV9386868.1 response regulator transcription factor [Reichenbachiella ulvae]